MKKFNSFLTKMEDSLSFAKTSKKIPKFMIPKLTQKTIYSLNANKTKIFCCKTKICVSGFGESKTSINNSIFITKLKKNNKFSYNK